MVPVGDAGQDLLLELRHQRVVRLAGLTRRGGELFLDVARLHAREHGIGVDVLQVIGDPVDEAVCGGAEFVGGGVELRHRAEV